MRAYPLAPTRETPGFQRGEMLCMGIRGKFGAATGLGFAVCGAARLGDQQPLSGIYQSRLTGYNKYGIIPGRKRHRYFVLMRNYAPTNPRTETQQANRTKFADACQAWLDLTPEQKAVYNERGVKKGRLGRGVFMSEYLKSH